MKTLFALSFFVVAGTLCAGAGTRLDLAPFSSAEIVVEAAAPLPPSALESVVREKTIPGADGAPRFSCRVDLQFPKGRPALAREILRTALRRLGEPRGGEPDLGAFPPDAAVERRIAEEIADWEAESALFGNDEEPAPARRELLISSRVGEPVAGNVVPVCIHFWRYAGGAHGVGGFNCKNFSLKDERELRLGDVFAENFEAPLRAALEKHDPRRRGNADFAYAEATDDFEAPYPSRPTPTENFLILRDGLLFVYNHYDLDCYAAGIVAIFTPYAEIEEILDAGFAAALRRSRRAVPADAAR